MLLHLEVCLGHDHMFTTANIFITFDLYINISIYN